MKKGFTLIELLAVILILGIIALIAIPTVNNVLEESREKAFSSTIKNIEKKVAETCSLELIKGEELTAVYRFDGNLSYPSVDIKGDLPSGYLHVDNDCNVVFNLATNKYIGTKENKNDEIVISKNERKLIAKSTTKSSSYVGYYADIEGDGIIDGVIFADLLTGSIGDIKWTTNYGDYSIQKIDVKNSKDYYISNTSYDGNFTNKPVISLANNSKGEDRFYVMSLDDFTTKDAENFTWYSSGYDKMDDYKTLTSVKFGDGRKNTKNMIEKWNNNYYGEKNVDSSHPDVWGVISKYVDANWFLPSLQEWAAFCNEIVETLGITQQNYIDYGLSDYYWGSSSTGNYYSAFVKFYFWKIENCAVNAWYPVRLAITF